MNKSCTLIRTPEPRSECLILGVSSYIKSKNKGAHRRIMSSSSSCTIKLQRGLYFFYLHLLSEQSMPLYPGGHTQYSIGSL